jgi:hypothetical protein
MPSVSRGLRALAEPPGWGRNFSEQVWGVSDERHHREQHVARLSLKIPFTVFLARPKTRAICELDMPSDAANGGPLPSPPRSTLASSPARFEQGSREAGQLFSCRADQYSVAVDRKRRRGGPDTDSPPDARSTGSANEKARPLSGVKDQVNRLNKQRLRHLCLES